MAFQRKSDKWKMKQWFVIYAPKAFNSAAIGEMPANDDKSALNRTITISLDVLTHNPQHAYTNLVLKAASIDGNAVHTKLSKMELIYSYVRSLVRRYHSVADCVLTAKTSDGTDSVAKLLIVTRGRTTHSRISALRKEATAFTREFFSNNEIDGVTSSIIEGKFQAELASHLNHITPLSKIEVKKLEIRS